MPNPELIRNKLDEYGIEIVIQYDHDGDYYFTTNDMIICYMIKHDKLSISFDASLKPERVANNILILQEIKNLNHDFEILDSFIYDKHKFVTGKEAHEAVEFDIGNKFLNDYMRKEELFQQMLKGHCIGTA